MRVAIIRKPEKGTKKFETKIRKAFKVVKKDPDLVFVIGGDGSMILAEHRYPGTPKLGLSHGRLAFLMREKCEKVDKCIKLLKDGKFKIEETFALECELGRCMNEIAILSPEQGRMTEPIIEIDGEKMPMRGDGIVIATPTGSTAYSLAAGGPAVAPGVKGIVITPISSQKRLPSFIIRPDHEIKIKGDMVVVIDGLVRKRMKKIKIKKSKIPVRFVKSRDDFFKRLFRRFSRCMM